MSVCLHLLSGGIDSTTALAWMLKYGIKRYNIEQLEALTVDYGQTHKKEIGAAIKIAEHYDVSLTVHTASLKHLTSPLTSDEYTFFEEPEEKHVSPTYVPHRNAFLILIAAQMLESRYFDFYIKPKYLLISLGVHHTDSPFYPDTRVAFLRRMEYMLNYSSGLAYEGEAFYKIVAPLANRKKADVVRLAKKLNVPFELTWTCYLGDNQPCWECPACRQREEAFKEAGIEDPLGSGFV